MTNLPSDPAANLAALIRCQSVTPAEGGALSALETMLAPLGFECARPVFGDKDTPDVENLFARRNGRGPHLVFAGHTDVVPVGDEAAWRHPPFGAEVSGGKMYGRGAVDMKGGIACFVAALARLCDLGQAPDGIVSLLITGDEEGPAINGTTKLLAWAAEKGERFDACLLGEPTNPDALGDTIKIGRRGSLTGNLTVTGTQGHVAYPHRADNPLPTLVALCGALLEPPLDTGTADFQPSNLELTTIDTGNRATNVIPAKVSAVFNIRFNDIWSADSLRAEIEARLSRATTGEAGYALEWSEPPSEAFVTRDTALADTLTQSIAAITGRQPELSTSGGTSDARFIKDYCPVVEFGLVGRTMHMVDEHVALADLETLTAIYADFITRWFAGKAGR